MSSSLGQIFSAVKNEYQRTRTKKILMVDALIVYALASAVVQVVYMVMVGTFPFNSFLSGFLCQLGLFALAGEYRVFVRNVYFLMLSSLLSTVSLRLQLTSKEEFQNINQEKAFGDFAFCAIVFLFVVFSFLG